MVGQEGLLQLGPQLLGRQRPDDGQLGAEVRPRGGRAGRQEVRDPAVLADQGEQQCGVQPLEGGAQPLEGGGLEVEVPGMGPHP